MHCTPTRNNISLQIYERNIVSQLKQQKRERRSKTKRGGDEWEAKWKEKWPRRRKRESWAKRCLGREMSRNFNFKFLSLTFGRQWVDTCLHLLSQPQLWGKRCNFCFRAQWYLLLDLKVVKRKFSWFLPNCYCARFLEGKKSHDALLPTREEEQESVALKSETLKPILMKYFPFSKYIFQELPFSRKRKKLIVKIELWLNQVNHEKLSI